MTIDRSVEHGHVLQRGGTYAGCGTELIEARCTGDVDTSAVIKKIGLSHGVVVNKSGQEVRVQYYGAFSPQGKAWRLKDQDKVPVPASDTLGDDDEMVELPTAIAGAPYLIPVVTPLDDTGTGTSGDPAILYFHFER